MFGLIDHLEEMKGNGWFDANCYKFCLLTRKHEHRKVEPSMYDDQMIPKYSIVLDRR
jgi:hypothetical protein